MAGERRRHADQDGVGLLEPAKSAVASKRLSSIAERDGVRGDVPDEAFAAVDLLDARLVDVEAEHRESGASRDQRERNADIAEADDADLGPAARDLAQQAILRRELLDRLTTPCCVVHRGCGYDARRTRSSPRNASLTASTMRSCTSSVR